MRQQFSIIWLRELQVFLDPLVQYEKAPRSGPRRPSVSEIPEDRLRKSPIEARLEGWRPICEPRCNPLTQLAAQPIFPRKSESSLLLRDDFLGQQIAQGLDQ